MRVLLGLAWLGATAVAQAQDVTAARLRSVAARNDSTALRALVRERPDDARELVRQLLTEAAHVSDGRNCDSVLAVAGRVAGAFAAAWEDSFLAGQVTRFEHMSAGERAAKIAADSVRRAGNDALTRRGVRAALVLWREALARATAGADTAGMAAASGNIGLGFYRSSVLDSSVAYLNRARTMAEATGDRRTALNALTALASVARDRGNLREAQSLYLETLELRERIGDTRGLAADHNNLGLAATELGDSRSARQHYTEALAVAEQNGLGEPAAIAHVGLGNLASADASFSDARKHYTDALEIYRSSSNETDAALVVHNLGLLALRRGDYASARALLHDALTSFERSGTVEDVVLVRRDLASVSAAAGDMRAARVQLWLAEQRLGGRPHNARLAAQLELARADLSRQVNDYPSAERQYGRAEKLFLEAGDTRSRAEAVQGLAVMLAERHEYGRAQALLGDVARGQLAGGDRRSAALTRLLIGDIQRRRRQLAEARLSVAQATEELRALGDAVGEAAALSASADLQLESGSASGAEALYRRGLARLQGHSAPDVSWQLFGGLGEALRRSGQIDDAEAMFRASAEQIEQVASTFTVEERRSTFMSDKWEVYAQLAAVERQRGELAAAFQTSERMRARQTLALLGRGRVKPSIEPDSGLVEREQDLRRQIGELMQRVSDEARFTSGSRDRADIHGADVSRAVTREALIQAQEEYSATALQLREQESGFARIARLDIASWRDVASRLERGEVMLEYLVADSSTVVFVLAHDTLRVVELRIDRRTLESLVDFARGALARPRSAATTSAHTPSRAPLQRLYESLIAPVEAAGLLDGVRRLVIVPHLELHYLPFAALIRHSPAGDSFLVERYELAYAPSASVWFRLRERTTPNASGVLVVAPETRRLPGSRAEARAIGALYGEKATVLEERAASEAAFRVLAPNYGIVHLATFGVLNSYNPLFSYVAMTPGAGQDGRLEVGEVLGLTMHTRLLVLSACQTAVASGLDSDVPPGDDWVGLVEGFLGAGVTTVLATLWSVEDRTTASLMIGLHRELHAGRDEPGALADVQRRALRNSATADPFYWAGFVLVGGP